MPRISIIIDIVVIVISCGRAARRPGGRVATLAPLPRPAEPRGGSRGVRPPPPPPRWLGGRGRSRERRVDAWMDRWLDSCDTLCPSVTVLVRKCTRLRLCFLQL